MSHLEPHYRMTPPERLPPKDRQPVHVVLHNIRSAFNVGSIFRTADAGSVARLHLCGYTACPPNAKLQKTALGAFDYVPWTHHETLADCFSHLRAESIPIAAVERVEDSVSHTRYEWPQPVAVVFGNEVRGLTLEELEAVDAVVSIPMLGHKNTINVATAFGIVLFEILRRWRAV
ncbi:MAG: RNA methyltransferase [Candidatus Hydrogenedentota bacterium]